jgi:hypothetical protein
MRQILLGHRHPVRGQISLTTDGSEVKLECWWPEDRDTDEWFTMTDSYSHEGYEHSICTLMAGRRASIEGRFGCIKLVTPAYKMAIEVPMKISVPDK